MQISFHNADLKFTLKNKRELKQFIQEEILLASTYKNAKLSFVFCTDEYLIDINRKFLKHDTYTDIITFPLSDNPHVLEAEIYISIDRIKENAGKFSSPGAKHSSVKGIESELHRVIFHGILHLLGYKDKTKSQKEEMRAAEETWLKKYAKELAFLVKK